MSPEDAPVNSNINRDGTGETGAIDSVEFIRAIEIGQADAGLAAIAPEVPDSAAMPGDLALNEGQVGGRH